MDPRKTKLSDNLTLYEAIKSNTAIKYGIDNIPNDDQIKILKQTAENLFQPIRDYFGVPIHVSSMFRSFLLNEKIGGAENSDHMYCYAIDFDQDNRNSPLTNADIFRFIKEELEFTQLIWEFGDDNQPAWVHASYNPSNLKKEILRAVKEPHPNDPNRKRTKYYYYD